jgi:alkanesulfonate monooxygenase SsuD/methylene tetrahydromethanopterin reductase-like flavin-dependent oxidoreductase (luciferase family)
VRPLKVGVFINLAERMMDGETPRWENIKEMATVAEEVGFDSVWVPDHLIFKMEEGEPEGFWEAMSMLAAIAAVTSKVELGSAVNCVSFRNPALYAKMADTIDEISGGRFVVGLGAGYHDPEYEAFGYPTDYRYSRFEEAFTIIRSLLREGKVDFEGTYHSARECELRPRGPRPDGPRIILGTLGPKMLRLAAEHADEWNGWLATRGNEPENVEEMRELVDAACAEVGRDPATLKRSVGALMSPTGRRQPHLARLQPALTGSPEELAGYLREFAERGMDHVQIWVYPNTAGAIEEFGKALEILDTSG